MRAASVLAVIGCVLGCGHVDGPSLNPSPTASWPQGTPAAKRITFINDAAALAGRLHVAPRAVGLKTLDMPVDLGGGAARKPVLRWIGQLDPPKVMAENAHYDDDAPEQPKSPVPVLAATVTIAGNVALVTYMLTNDYFGGAIDAIDITNPEAPVLRATAMFEHMNVTNAEFHADEGTSGTGTISWPPRPATRSIPARHSSSGFAWRASSSTPSSISDATPWRHAQGVTVSGDRLFGTAGFHGGARSFDTTSGALLGEAAVDNEGGDARWVSAADGHVAVVSGGKRGQLDIFEPSTLARLGSYPFEGANIAASSRRCSSWALAHSSLPGRVVCRC